MATFQTRGKSIRAIIRLNGIYDSGTFKRKSDAVAWATKREAEILDTAQGRIPDKTFGQLLEKYRDIVAPKRRGARWETVRINKIILGNPENNIAPDPITHVRLSVLNQSHFAAWRDRRLECVSAGSVLREWNLLSGACTIAINEWKWLTRHPMKGISRPEKPESRDRRISEEEIEKILFCSGYSRDVPPCTTTARVGAVFIFAIETGMRAGEICALTHEDVNLEERYCSVTGIVVGGGKTQAARRNVPLSIEAMRIIKQIPADESSNKVFRMSSTQSLDTLFRKVKDRAGIENLHFHDSRHEAITRLSKKLDVLALARMIGHRDIKELMVYYNLSATDISKQLD